MAFAAQELHAGLVTLLGLTRQVLLGLAQVARDVDHDGWSGGLCDDGL